jgi:hypothetical protein
VPSKVTARRLDPEDVVASLRSSNTVGTTTTTYDIAPAFE